MDLTTTIAPKSDQLNADDLMVAPVTVTIKDVQQGSLEQPVNVNLVEYPGRAYRPSKSMRRVMVAAWGPDTTSYAGHRLTLFRNPEIKFGADKVGGIEISALSHIDDPLTVALTATRGKRKNFTVQPLKSRDWLAELELAGDNRDAVKALGTAARAGNAPAEVMAAITTKYNALGKVEQ